MGLERFSSKIQSEYAKAIGLNVKQDFYKHNNSERIAKLYKELCVDEYAKKNNIKEGSTEYEGIEETLRKEGIFDVSEDKMVDTLIAPDIEDNLTNKSIIDGNEAVLDYISTKEEYQNETAIAFFIQDAAHKELINPSKRAYFVPDQGSNKEFLDNGTINFIYRPKTDVKNTSHYNTPSSSYTGLKGKNKFSDVQTDYYQKYLDEIQSVQIDIPKDEESGKDLIDEQAATMIIIGEYLDRKYKDTLINAEKNLFTENLDGFEDTTYWSRISQDWFTPNRIRPNSYSIITIGKDARANAKNIIDNVGKDPEKAKEAAAKLENVIRTLSVDTFNLTQFKKTVPRMRLIAAAYESLQDPIFAKYITLSKQELGNCKAAWGTIDALDRFGKSVYAYNDRLVKAQALNNTKSIAEDPEFKDAYLDFAADLYISNYFSNAQHTIAHSRGGDAGDPRIGVVPFAVAYGENPELTRKEIRKMLQADPKFAEELKNASCKDGVEKSKCLLKNSMEGIGLAMINNNPDYTRRTFERVNTEMGLNGIEGSLEEAKTMYGESPFKAMENAIKDWRDFCEKASLKDPCTAKDIKAGYSFLGAIEKTSSDLSKRISAVGDDVPEFITKLNKESVKVRGKMSEEYAQTQKLEPIVKKVEAFTKMTTTIKENVNYQQYRLRIALDKIENIRKAIEGGNTVNEKITDINKVVNRACASMLANKLVQMEIESKSDILSPDKIAEKISDQAIKDRTKEILRMPAFKEVMKSLQPDKIKDLAASSKDVFPEHAVNELFGKFRNEVAKGANAVAGKETKLAQQAGI